MLQAHRPSNSRISGLGLLMSEAQADKRLRPFARRDASTLRPAAVAVRARNPWRRLRTRLLGW